MACRLLTRKNALWLARTNAASWVIQGVAFGLLTLLGVGAVNAVVTAKVAAWTVFAGQCLGASRTK